MFNHDQSGPWTVMQGVDSSSSGGFM